MKVLTQTAKNLSGPVRVWKDELDGVRDHLEGICNTGLSGYGSPARREVIASKILSLKMKLVDSGEFSRREI